jgi:uncharacterized membrane protein YukC
MNEQLTAEEKTKFEAVCKENKLSDKYDITSTTVDSRETGKMDKDKKYQLAENVITPPDFTAMDQLE